MPPEMISGGSWDGRACDVWSLGICLFAQATGFMPWVQAKPTDVRFQAGRLAQSLGRSIVRRAYEYNRMECPLSTDLVDLLDRLLMVRPEQRCSLDEALAMPWLEEAPEELVELQVVDPVPLAEAAPLVEAVEARAAAELAADHAVESGFESVGEMALVEMNEDSDAAVCAMLLDETPDSLFDQLAGPEGEEEPLYRSLAAMEEGPERDAQIEALGLPPPMPARQKGVVILRKDKGD